MWSWFYTKVNYILLPLINTYLYDNKQFKKRLQVNPLKCTFKRVSEFGHSHVLYQVNNYNILLKYNQFYFFIFNIFDKY